MAKTDSNSQDSSGPRPMVERQGSKFDVKGCKVPSPEIRNLREVEKARQAQSPPKCGETY